ncbi:MAG: sulfur oxidation protein, flavocytochrome C [Hydrogenophilales bacterium CG_4_9_14_3_um_filter_59_35]|nr:MAG: sulfur oxidation protein, flavocytochrome C [Hydrogenophilales bacterium CG18_big_fil_WC_8_21_14_2_50_58_12]PJB08144.1 MAG: sulfur oxidation protein, flavocytochrome C [Hydrogenophilales bacterium CG_4_9_14_3_um_filter_59_35]
MDKEKIEISRRGFIKMSGLAAASLATVGATVGLGSQTAQAADTKVRMLGMGVKANLPKAKGPRLVIVGGGTSGLTIAKYAKKEYPKFDVVLVEKRDMYSSCFSSNLLYAGVVNLEFLADHSFLDAAKNNKYTFFNATCTGLDRTARKLYTSEGEIDYDYLVLAPGISYDYSRIGVKDAETETALRTMYPAGFTKTTEHVSIRAKVQGFEGGVFMLNVPGGNYRCLPAPYERACMIASYFKKNKIKAKLLVLDHNPDITIKTRGFHAAFNDLYKDIIEYKPSVELKGVDLGKKEVKSEFDSYHFDDAAIYPGVRGSKLLETLGVMDAKNPQREALIDTLKYNVIGDDRVYVTGDSRPHPYSKSANTANTEGKYVAKVLAARAQGKEIDWYSPETICFSLVNADPLEGISVDATYAYDPKTKGFSFSKDTKMFEDRDASKGRGTLSWAKGMYRDLFA